MPVKVFKPLYEDYQGYDTGAGTAYNTSTVNGEVQVGRNYYTRIHAMDIPPGSTINSATLTVDVIPKDKTTSANFTYNVAMDNNFNSTFPYQNIVMSTTGSYSDFITGQTFTWNTSGVQHQQFNVNVTSQVQARVNNASWKNGGYFSFRVNVTAETGTLYISFVRLTPEGESFPTYLTVDYTPPAGNTSTVVSYIENPKFLVDTKCWLPQSGFFSEWDTAVVTGGVAVPAAHPNGLTTCVKVEAPTGVTKPINVYTKKIFPREAEGTEYYFSCWVYVPSGLPDVTATDPNINVSYYQAGTSVKNQWTRIGYKIIPTSDRYFNVGVLTTSAPSAAGNAFYLTGALLTPTDYMPGYFDGTMSNVTGHTFYFPANTDGISAVTVASKPFVAINPMGDVSSIQKPLDTTWTYSDSRPQTKSRIRYRSTS